MNPADALPEATLLLVDDRPANLQALEAALEPLGYKLISVSSGEKALKRLLRDEVSVILLDVQMPGMDGLETARRIKERERTSDIPIIFLSALSTQAGHALEGFTTGVVSSKFSDTIVFSVLILALVLRPQGVFSRA